MLRESPQRRRSDVSLERQPGQRHPVLPDPGDLILSSFVLSSERIVLILVLFAQQAFNFAFKNYFRSVFGQSKEKNGSARWLAGNVASGSAAGATTSLLLYHLEYARTRLGTDALECRIKGRRQFEGLIDVYRKTLASDGIAGLYRGFGVSITGITLYRGLYFGIYDSLKPVLLTGPLEVIILFMIP